MKFWTAITIFAFLLVASANDIQKFDKSLYDAIHDGWKSDFCDVYFFSATAMGGMEAYLSANLALLCFGDEKMKESAKLASVGLGMTMIATQILKCAVGRERPEEKDLCRCRSSFPSGHSTAAFTMAYIYGGQYPKLRIPLYVFAISVGLSRIYLGEHYPTDVLFGAVIGTTGGIVVMKNKDFILSLGLR